MLEPVHDGSDAVMERIGLLEDMRREREQQDMFTAFVGDAPPYPIAMDEVNCLVHNISHCTLGKLYIWSSLPVFRTEACCLIWQGREPETIG